MRIILLINAIVELLAGIVIILNPGLLFYNKPMDVLALNISKMYGIGAAVIGLFSYLIFRYSQTEILIKYCCLTIIAFHLFLTFHLYGMFSFSLLNHPGPIGFHLALTLLTGILYVKYLK